MSELKEVYAFLQENEEEVADSICYASELLLSELDEALKALKRRRLEATDSDNDDLLMKLTSYRTTLKKYRDEIECCLVFPQKNDNTDYNNLETTFEDSETDPVDYASYKVNSNIEHSLLENFVHKKICAFSFEGTKYSINTWKDTLILLCNLLAKEDINKFNGVVGESRFKGRKIQYFTNHSIQGKNEKIVNTNIYVWINLNANSIVELIRDLLIYFSKNINDFKIFLRADYTNLHRKDLLC